MANKSSNRHIKRLNLPSYVKVHKKKYKYILKPIAGPHSLKDSLALGVFLRDYIKLGINMREIKYILNNGKVRVDGRIIKEPKFPIGFQDVIEIEGVGKYKIDLDQNGYFTYKEYQDNNKILKVINKIKVKGGKLQYTFHDGRTMVSEDNSIKIGDSVVYDFVNKKILKIISQKDSKHCIVLKGKHRGFRGNIKEILNIGKKVADIINDKGELIRTDYKYLFLLGE